MSQKLKSVTERSYFLQAIKYKVNWLSVKETFKNVFTALKPEQN